MSKKVFVAVTAIALAAAAAMPGTVFAQGRGRGSDPGFGPDFESNDGWTLLRMATELNLTADQQEQIKSITLAGRAKERSLREQRLAGQAVNHNGIGIPAPSGRQVEPSRDVTIHDEFDIEVMRDEQDRVRRELIIEQERTNSQIYALLTPEQRQKVQQMLEKRKQKRRDLKQKRPKQQQQVP